MAVSPPPQVRTVPLPLPVAPRRTSPGALDRIDEAFLRLRLAPVGILGTYYAGSLPFVLALLYFWTDMRRNPDAARDATGASLGMAVLFAGMKVAHAVFAARLRAVFARQPAPRWTWKRLGRVALVQTIIQPSGLFLLPLAAIVTVPFGWVYAFYANVTALGGGEEDAASAWTVTARAARAALRDPKGNHLALLILSLLGLIAWLNLAAATLFLPQLARMFTGEENAFTLSGLHIFNSTFFAVTFALVYLALDPLAKAFYALRCFHEDARRTGEDLASALRALPAVAAVSVLFLCLTASSAVASSVPTPTPAAARADTVSAPALGRSMEDVLRRREFAWRAPRPTATPAPDQMGPVGRFFDGIRSWFKRGTEQVGHWIDRAMAWLRRWQRSRDDSAETDPGARGLDPATVRGLFYGLVAGCVGLLAFLVWKNRRGLRVGALAGRAAPDQGPRAVPDLADEDVLASQLPEDEWLRLAHDLAARGERRLALRAYYLSTLAGLGARGWLAVARHKSNRDYLGELRRRARDRSAEQAAFARNVGRFERVWYGPHPADDALLAEFQADRERTLAD